MAAGQGDASHRSNPVSSVSKQAGMRVRPSRTHDARGICGGGGRFEYHVEHSA